MHGNARSSPLGRLGMVLRVLEEGEPVARVARRGGHVSAVRVQVGASLPGGRPSRFGGPVVAAALFPHAHQPGGGKTGVAGGAGPVVGVYGVPERTISRTLRRHGMLRLWECDLLIGEPLKPPPRPVVRHERGRPGELFHTSRRGMEDTWPGKRSGGMDLCALCRGRLHPPRLLRTVAVRGRNHRRRVHRPRLAHLPPTGHHRHHRHHRHCGDHDRQPLEIHPQPPIRRPARSARHPSYHDQNPIYPAERQSERYSQTLKPKWVNSQPWPDNQTRNQALNHWLHYSIGGKTTNLQTVTNLPAMYI